jgi:hypothetical protein
MATLSLSTNRLLIGKGLSAKRKGFSLLALSALLLALWIASPLRSFEQPVMLLARAKLAKNFHTFDHLDRQLDTIGQNPIALIQV